MKTDIYDFLFWLLLGIALLIVLLKIIGVITTPDIINYLPIISIVFAAGIVYGKLISFINTMYKKTDYLKKKIDNFDNKFNSIEKGLVDHDNRIINLEKGHEMILDVLKKK